MGDARGGGPPGKGAGPGRPGEARGASTGSGVGVHAVARLGDGGRRSPPERALEGLCQGVCVCVCVCVRACAFVASMGEGVREGAVCAEGAGVYLEM